MDVIEIDAILAAAAQTNQSSLTEADAKRIFKAAGMPVVAEMAVKTAQKTADAARELGFPVVLKGFGSTILHKTEAGLVCPGLATAAQVETAARKMTDQAGKDLEGFLVAHGPGKKRTGGRYVQGSPVWAGYYVRSGGHLYRSN